MGETPHEDILAYRASLEPFSDEELAQLLEQAGLEIPQFNRRRAMRALEIAHFLKIWKIKKVYMIR